MENNKQYNYYLTALIIVQLKRALHVIKQLKRLYSNKKKKKKKSNYFFPNQILDTDSVQILIN